MKKRLSLWLAALLVPLGFVVASAGSASANETDDCNYYSGEYKSAKFCLEVTWHRLDNGNPRITDTTLRMYSPYSDGELGFVNMHNIDYYANRVSDNKDMYHHVNGFSGDRIWDDTTNFSCGYCQFSIDYVIGWTSPIGWPDTQAHQSLYIR